MKRLLCALLAVVMLVPFAGCKSSGPSGKGPIAIVVPAADHGWLAGVAYFAQQKCKELGLAEGSGYKLVTSSNVNDQANQIEEMINLKCSAIVLQPHNDEVSVAAQKIVDAKIPLIVFDRKVNVSYNAYIAGDNKAIGTQSADFLGEKLGGKGLIGVLNVPSSGSVSTERVNGFKQEIGEKYPDIKMFDMTAPDFTQESGLKTATDALVAEKNVDAIFSIDDESSLGILQAVKDAKRTDIKFISGAGGSQSYFQKINTETSPTLFTATYSPSMIQDAIQAAVDIVGGKSVTKDNVIPPTVVTKDNVAKLLDANSPY